MKLVEKDKNHTTNYILCEDEKNAILNFCGAGLTASSEEEDTARRIIRKMDKNGLYLECDCLPPEQTRPGTAKWEVHFFAGEKPHQNITGSVLFII